MSQTAPNRYLTASLGLLAVGLFAVAYIVFSLLTPNFDPAHDFISKLGAQGQPYAVWWNTIGFLVVGMFLSAFGLLFGRLIGDASIGLSLAVSGFGFAVAALPTDLARVDSFLSKAHYVSICISLGGWCFGMARIRQVASLAPQIRRNAGIAAVLLLMPILCRFANLISLPTTHRLLLAVVFGWIAVTSIGLMLTRPQGGKQSEPAK